MFTIIAWRLSTAAVSEASLARTIAWLLCGMQLAIVVLSLRYFGPFQAGFSLGCATLLAWGALRLNPSTGMKA
jgi:hypothetical protein